VDRIGPGELRARGHNAILLDIDNTLVPRDTKEPPPEVRAWVASLAEANLPACLLSNNFHATVLAWAREFDLPIVRKAMKPAPFAYLRALRLLGVRRREAVVIGDQILTDVLGAHLLGIPAILVVPQSTIDLWYTHIFRRAERVVLKDMQPGEKLEGTLV
jgi:HAD superfamily phosphatase (TIGR01668 family)